MARIIRWLGFWGSFYVFHEYSSRSDEYPFNSNYKYPSYVIIKEKMIKPLFKGDFDSL